MTSTGDGPDHTLYYPESRQTPDSRVLDGRLATSVAHRRYATRQLLALRVMPRGFTRCKLLIFTHRGFGARVAIPARRPLAVSPWRAGETSCHAQQSRRSS